ncbi:MAG TPA: hypothetical protein VMG12_41640 [Polyangiaceae bacterium]|nr:hypothetical protein [Polyangiaceae bacterium]
MAWRAQGRKPKPREGVPLAPWLSLAAAAHALVFGAALSAERDTVLAARPPADAVTDRIWLDLIADSPAAPVSAADAASSELTTTPPAAVALETPRSGRASAVAGRVLPKAMGVDATPYGTEASQSRAALPEGAAAGDGIEAAAPGAEGAAPSADGTGPALSLRDLGVDRGSNPFIGSVTELPTERQLANQRLRESLRGELAKRDQARGLGPEGPAVTAVTEIVMASATAPNTTALLRVRANGAGAVTLVDVLEADRDSDEWQRIAGELVRALAGKKLRVPPGSNGVSFQLRVVSRVQLPSGADPGLAIDVLGIPVKKGEGKRSSKLSILSPMIQEVEVPNSNGQRVPVVSFSLIGGAGDLADIGAVARRLVTAYLVAMDTDIPRESATPAAPSTATHPGPSRTAPAVP